MYVVASAEAVGLFLLLSAFNAVTRGALIVGLAAVFVIALAVWVLAGTDRRPSPPSRPFADLGEHGALVALAVAVGLGLAYVVSLIVATPPNGWDPTNYHLARAGFWLQSGGVGYIANAYDQRLNFNPPNGEIEFAFVLGITRDENLVGFVQFFAVIASAVGVFALARRIGLRRPEAAFGALAFLSLPLIALQSSGAKNDLVVASYLVAAALFLLGGSRSDIALGSVATALAIGTKFTAAYGLAILLALILVVPPAGRRALRLTGLAVGGLVGSYWYVVNAHETGHFLGDQSNVAGLTAPLHPPENLLTAFGSLVDNVDLSGARGADILLYPMAALALAIGLTVFNRMERKAIGIPLTIALVASPLVLVVISKNLGHPGLVRLYDGLGRPRAYLADGDPTASSPTTAKRHRLLVRPVRTAPPGRGGHRRRPARSQGITYASCLCGGPCANRVVRPHCADAHVQPVARALLRVPNRALSSSLGAGTPLELDRLGDGCARRHHVGPVTHPLCGEAIWSTPAGPQRPLELRLDDGAMANSVSARPGDRAGVPLSRP